MFVLFGYLGVHGAAIVSLSRFISMYIILSQVLPIAYRGQFNMMYRNPMISGCWITHRNV